MKNKNWGLAQYYVVPMLEADQVLVVPVTDYKKPGETPVAALGNEIHAWCADANIEADLLGAHMLDNDTTMQLVWKVPSEKHRLLFSLKWGAE